MGQAKQRGTYAERLEAALQRDADRVAQKIAERVTRNAAMTPQELHKAALLDYERRKKLQLLRNVMGLPSIAPRRSK